MSMAVPDNLLCCFYHGAFLIGNNCHENLDENSLLASKKELSPLFQPMDYALIFDPADPHGRHFFAMIRKVKDYAISVYWLAEKDKIIKGSVPRQSFSKLTSMESFLPVRCEPDVFEKIFAQYRMQTNDDKRIGYKLAQKV